MLDASTAQALILTAPAGYGKTSLVCEWLEGQPNIAWYRATSASADLAAFSVGIAEVMEPFLPGAGDRLRQRIRVGDPPEKALRPLAELLAEDIAGWPDGGWLVVDDYHLVADSAPVEEFMDWLLMLAPVRVIVTTRHRPAWATARRVLYGEAIEVGHEQLAMTTEEATKVLEGRSPDAVNAIVAQAQGWPALIGLAALSSGTEVPTERVSEELFRYFAEEVFRNEPPEVQEFMLVAAVPQSFTAKTARDTLGIAGAERHISHLQAEGLLAPATSGELALHPLLREYLRRKFETEDPAAALALTTRVIDFARCSERWEEGVELCLARRDLQTAADLVGEAAPALLATGQTEMLARWLNACGNCVPKSPRAMLAHAELLLRRGKLREAIGVALSLVGSLPPGDPRLSHAWSIAGRAAHFLSDELDALGYHTHAFETAVSESDYRESLWGLAVVSTTLERPDASDHIRRFTSFDSTTPESRLRAAVAAMLGAQLTGSLLPVADEVHPSLGIADYVADPMIRTSFLAQLSYVNSLRARYGDALELALQAEAIATTMRLAPSVGYCRVARAHAEIGLRKFRDVRNTLAEIGAGIEGNDPFLDVATAALQTRLVLVEHRTDAWLTRQSLPPSASRAPRSIVGELLSLRAIAAAARGDSEATCRLVQRSRATTAAIEARFYSHVAEIILVLNKGDAEPSRVALQTLVAELEESDMWDALVMLYRVVPAALDLASNLPDHLDVLEAVLVRSNDSRLAASAGLQAPATASLGPLSQLTPRETEVLWLLSEGLSNAEISRRLVVETSTVKVHVHRVLRKLGVKNRAQAGVMARDLLP